MSEGPRGRSSLTIQVARVPGGRARLTRDLARLAELAARRAGRDVDLSFVLLDDPAMADLHLRFAGKPGPTDVLAFPLGDEPILHGEVCLSVDTARRNADRLGHPPYDEILLYAVHGVMHLLGHDDHDPIRRRRMRRAERRALASLGVPPTFRRSARR